LGSQGVWRRPVGRFQRVLTPWAPRDRNPASSGQGRGQLAVTSAHIWARRSVHCSARIGTLRIVTRSIGLGMPWCPRRSGRIGCFARLLGTRSPRRSPCPRNPTSRRSRSARRQGRCHRLEMGGSRLDPVLRRASRSCAVHDGAGQVQSIPVGVERRGARPRCGLHRSAAMPPTSGCSDNGTSSPSRARPRTGPPAFMGKRRASW